MRVDLADQLYIVNWHTSLSHLDPTKTYRIRVLVAGTELGHADVDVVSKSTELKSVNTSAYVPLLNGQTLPIKFRIEEGAVFVVGTSGGTLNAFNGALTLTVPAGALATELGITVQTAIVATNGFVVATPVYDLGPSGTKFLQPVTLALHYDIARLPTGVRPVDLSLATLQNGAWVPVSEPDEGTSSNDEATGTLSATITHFSDFAGVTPRRLTTPIVLSPPWTPGQFWVPRTYEGHMGNSWTKGVDFYYATNQTSGFFSNFTSGEYCSGSQCATVGQPVRAAYPGRARRHQTKPFLCEASWVPVDQQSNFVQNELWIVSHTPTLTFTTDYLHIRINPGIIDSDVSAGDIVGWVADPDREEDHWDGNGVSIVGCASHAHFMFAVWPGEALPDRTVSYSLDNGDFTFGGPGDATTGGEVVFSGQVDIGSQCGQNCRTYSAMPRRPTAVSIARMFPRNTEGNYIGVFWTKNDDPDFAGYKVIRSNSPGVTSSGDVLATLTNQKQVYFRDQNLAPGTYFYRVFVVNKAGLSSPSNNEVSGIVFGPNQVIDRIPGVPEPGDNQYPSDVAIPISTFASVSYDCPRDVENPDTCVGPYSPATRFIWDDGHVGKLRRFALNLSGNRLNNVSNLKFQVHNGDVMDLSITATDDSYGVFVPAVGSYVSVQTGSSRLMEFQAYGVGVGQWFIITTTSGGVSNPTAGTITRVP